MHWFSPGTSQIHTWATHKLEASSLWYPQISCCPEIGRPNWSDEVWRNLYKIKKKKKRIEIIFNINCKYHSDQENSKFNLNHRQLSHLIKFNILSVLSFKKIIFLQTQKIELREALNRS